MYFMVFERLIPSPRSGLVYVMEKIWCRGASLCSGNFHPDAVLHKERSLKADKKAYFLELQKYHNEYVVVANFSTSCHTVV